MKIIKRNSDGVVIYAREDLQLTDTQASGGDWVHPGTTTANATLVDGVTLPEKFTGGAYSYSGGAFAVVNQALIDQAFPSLVPETVTMVQARAALIIQGDFDSVQAVIDSQTGVQGQLARNAWEKGTKVSKSDALVQALKPALGWSNAKLDALFILADTL
ncbi:MAG: hypothetical protein ACKVOO_10875 [Burkholderiaceae bacterium]